jgi:hypothetical protein
LHENDACVLDTDATCAHPTIPDGGVAEDPCVPTQPSLVMPLGAFGGSVLSCQRSCSSEGDCQKLTDGSHVPHHCIGGQCTPSLPLITPCVADSSCIGDLKCLSVPSANGAYQSCTAPCRTPDDCAGDAALGTAFTCAGGVCVPRTASGCPAPPLGDACLSHRPPKNGICRSPAGWTCDRNDQCESASCMNGRCAML